MATFLKSSRRFIILFSLSPVDSHVDFFSRDKFCATSFIIEPCGTHCALDCRVIPSDIYDAENRGGEWLRRHSFAHGRCEACCAGAIVIFAMIVMKMGTQTPGTMCFSTPAQRKIQSAPTIIIKRRMKR